MTGTGHRPYAARFLLAQVVKSHKGRRLAEVARHVVVGPEEAIARVIVAMRGGTQINTAYSERLNATFRRLGAPDSRLERHETSQ